MLHAGSVPRFDISDTATAKVQRGLVRARRWGRINQYL